MKKDKNKEEEKKSIFKKMGEMSSKLTKIDFIIMGILIFIYSVLAFYNLGTFKNPQTFYHFINEGENISLELSTQSQFVSKLRYFNGPETGKFTIMISEDGERFDSLKELETKSTFAWEDIEIGEKFKYISLVSETPNSYIGEVQLYDEYGDKILSKMTSQQSNALVDEQDTVPVRISYLNSTYFDEIYFATSAYQYTEGLPAMEWVHPPLGKLIMALPILIFGMCTFAYRLMGTIAGILMIAVIYILAKRLFKNTKWALFAGALMAFDNFHFAQTRMGTVDSFLVLFIMLAVLFMKDYMDLDKDAPFKQKRKKLLLSGIFIGCAIATKWTGLYAGLGLAIVLFVHLFKQYEDKRKTKINNKKMTTYIAFGLGLLALLPITIYYISMATVPSKATIFTLIYYILLIFIFLILMIKNLIAKDKKLIKLFLVCILSFIIIPIVIYILSYMLFPNVVNYADNSISGIAHQIKDMYHYHSTLTATHPFQSTWYEWPIMYRPVWLYFGNVGGNIVSTIVGIGNPFIWWFGIIAAIATAIRAFIKKESENFFIIVFILCSYIPYIFIGRAMFMYHYFPTLPFVMLAIVSFMKYITEKHKTNMYLNFYVALVIITFFVFYPVTSGLIINSEYVDALKWLSSWIF